MKKIKTISHLLSGSSLNNLIIVLAKNRREISWKFLPQILTIFIIPVLFFPLHLWENLFYSLKIKKTQIDKDPVFIIGHWRTGTTYLHNLLCQDKQFGFPTTYQCFLPGVFLTGKNCLKAIHKTTLPDKRPMDDVKMDSDFPQEEEFIISALSPYSYYQCYFFPKKMIQYFTSYALVSPEISEKWENLFLFIVKKFTYVCKGKQLIMKNPVNTLRIRHLIKIFPNAKFIYLYRESNQVLKSTHKLFDRFLALYSFQIIEETELKNNILKVYNQMLSQYDEQKKLIGKHNLVEVDYGIFIKNTFGEMERIYGELQLDGFETAKDDFRKYILVQSTYQPDTYDDLNTIPQQQKHIDHYDQPG